MIYAFVDSQLHAFLTVLHTIEIINKNKLINNNNVVNNGEINAEMIDRDCTVKSNPIPNQS